MVPGSALLATDSVVKHTSSNNGTEQSPQSSLLISFLSLCFSVLVFPASKPNFIKCCLRVTDRQMRLWRGAPDCFGLGVMCVIFPSRSSSVIIGLYLFCRGFVKRHRGGIKKGTPTRHR
ncbi:hypothetical protein J3E74DRAFT_299234 [Bipolaris maydis]|nr:hypothetical protein J3E73DRAFT_273987 [Bipolaris maydis]KAJ5065085.1 hypothetical protein J3E74DRAFT_299234 [Bipolaris maydis]KAJ6285635.1 hypothetical protein J3E71DRAFT_256681 [Bipolaris maydis]